MNALNQEKPGLRADRLMSRLERKIALPPHLAGFMVAWLRHCFIVDARYPKSVITSLYLDTPELDSYHECLNGDIYKNKIRLRWYDRPENDRDFNAYIEVKSKRGFNTVKHRSMVTLPGALINNNRIPDLVELPKSDEILAGLGRLSCQPLLPVILISYCRYRFRDPETGTSITLDSGISSRAVMPGVGWGIKQIQLKPAVLELKSLTMNVPRAFQELNQGHLQWSAFSKYARCLESHLEKPDVVSGVPG